MNIIKDSCAWIAPDGTFHEVKHNHGEVATSICESLYNDDMMDYLHNHIGVQHQLLRIGYIRIDCYKVQCGKKPTASQIWVIRQMANIANYINRGALKLFIANYFEDNLLYYKD